MLPTKKFMPLEPENEVHFSLLLAPGILSKLSNCTIQTVNIYHNKFRGWTEMIYFSCLNCYLSMQHKPNHRSLGNIS